MAPQEHNGSSNSTGLKMTPVSDHAILLIWKLDDAILVMSHMCNTFVSVCH